MTELPTAPIGWAIHLTKLLNVVYGGSEESRFPINISEVAIDYTKQVFPDEPITMVAGIPLSCQFEGKIVPKQNKIKEWGIFYNDSIQSKGRQNFTLAHELGHYLLHRDRGEIKCERKDMFDWKSEYNQIEAQANLFASYLLIPFDDFRRQMGSSKPTMALFKYLQNRYQASLSAVILKWIEMTPMRAMFVIGKDGYMDWARSSESLFKSGIYFNAKQHLIELPPKSLAAQLLDTELDSTGVWHPRGVWNDSESVQEITIISQDRSITMTVLIFESR